MPKKFPADYTLPYPAHYQILSKNTFKIKDVQTGKGRVYWAPSTNQTDNCMFYDAGNLSQGTAYVPPTDWPKHGNLVSSPMMVIFHYIMADLSSARKTQWTSIGNSVAASLATYKKVNCYTNGPTNKYPNGSTLARWLQFLCPRMEDVTQFIGLDVLHIVIYQDIGLGTGQSESGSLGDTTDSNFTGYPDGVMSAVEWSPPYPDLTSFQADHTQRNAAYTNDKNNLIKAFPYFLRSKTLVYYDNSPLQPAEYTPVFSEAHVEFQVASRICCADPPSQYGPCAPGRPGPSVFFHTVYTWANDNSKFFINPPNCYIDGGGNVHYYFQPQNYNIWAESQQWQPQWLQKICTDLQGYGWEYKGQINQSSGAQILTTAIKSYYGLQ